MKSLDIRVFGLSITSAWGNGHATTYRSLLKALANRGHRICFYEKDVPWYAHNRDLPNPAFCQKILYRHPEDLRGHAKAIARADLVILGSYVSDAAELAHWIHGLGPACFAFYDIDTPVTLAKLRTGNHEYLHPDMIPEFDLYLSFTGGPILKALEQEFGARKAAPLYCSVDPELYFPDDLNANSTPLGHVDEHKYRLGYLGTFSSDRQDKLQRLLLDVATAVPQERFCVAGAQYPEDMAVPVNVERIEHIPPPQHRRFYNDQRFTLNLTRSDMVDAGHSPSVRLFEAGACGVPVISDDWPGMASFFVPGEDILIASSTDDVVHYLNISNEERFAIVQRFRSKVLNHHTSQHRAEELEQLWQQATTRTLDPVS